MCSTSYAASLGHSRIVSAPGQPLRIDLPVNQLTPDDLRSFNVTTPPASAWAQAGLTPPVDLTSISLDLVDGYTPGSKVIQLRSTDPFNKPVADLLLDVRTASGQQRYQVSLLAHASQDALRSASGATQGAEVRGATASAAGQPANRRLLRGMIRVKKGDTMFAIAQRHAVRGVTVYQMMMALQKANPHAFIEHNINLVKAGATLAMPDMAGLTAISDKEARRLFAQQAQAFALYRQRLAASTSPVAKEGSASRGTVTPAAGQAAPAPAPRASEDQLRLSRGQTAPAASASGTKGAATADGSSAAGSSGLSGTAGAAGSAGSGGLSGATASNDADVRADDSTAARKQIDESKERVSQLEQNVKNLNQALQSQGGAASDLIVEGAKGLSQSLSDVADAVTSTGNGDSAAPASGTAAQGSSATAAGSTGTGAAGAAAAGAGAAGAGAAGTAGGNTGQSQQGGASASGQAGPSHGSGHAAAAGSAAGGASGANAANAAAGASSAAGSASAQGGGSAASVGSAGSAVHGSAAAGSNATTAGGAPADGSTVASANGSNAASAAGVPAAGVPAAGTSPAGTSANGTSAGGTSAAGTSAGGAASGGAASTNNSSAGAPVAGTPAAGTAASGSAGAAGSAASGNTANSTGNTAAGSSSGATGAASGANLASAARGPGGAGQTASGGEQSKSSSGTDRAGDVAEPVTTKAEQTVSWIQEHMLGVITALLALIVLVIAWLLRRANTGRDDGRDDHSGLITEAMVREKLDQINLDLSQSADETSRRR
jgi:pilus assembly protein FimV